SFSKEYVGSLNNYKGYTPFLDSLIGHSLVFTHAFSNGFRSMDAMPAVLMAVPCLMNDPIITSAYSTNNFTALAKLLKTKSYATAFFHGGNQGTLGLDGFAKLSGFDNYFGRTEYNNDDDFDGNWGIYDEPFLQYVIQHIDSLPEPFFVTGFTLSSHYPYTLPEKYENKFTEGPLRIHRVVRYTDFALQGFFETAKTKPWFNNTIFIISADHPAQSVIPSKAGNINGKTNLPDKELLQYYKNSSGRYAIPLLIYAPGDTTLQGEITTTIQQTDVMPTILNLLHFEKPYIAFGNDVFDSTVIHAAFHYYNGLYQITSGDYCLIFDGEKPIALYEKSDVGHIDNLLEKEPEKTLELENILKAYLQEFSHRLRENKLMVE
ncbi:MAG: LTA synthase family protein, partial [Bacteroidales bacterium]|nr:LTA synthase family protein [Bacteroidales bacterium]